MNQPRLSRLAEFLAGLDPSRFTLEAWVVAGIPIAGPGVDALPESAKACPIGWLPAFEPEWCWVALQDRVQVQKAVEVFPIWKESPLWVGEWVTGCTPLLDPVVCGVWRQVQSWFDISDLPQLDHFFTASGYQEATPVQVANRISNAIKVVQL